MKATRIADAIKNLLELDLKPLDIISKKSLENAVALVNALGGSTNAVLHYLAIAHAAGIDFTLDDFQRVSDRTPLIADLKPSGEYLMEDVHGVGGTPAVMKYLLEERLFTWRLYDCNGKNPGRESQGCKTFEF